MKDDASPARFRWLPPGLRPPEKMVWRQERVFLLVGAAAFFAGYDQNVFGFAAPQIQASLHIPENELGLTVSYFRLAAIVAMLLAASADLVGRRRLLLITICGQGLFTFATAFAPDYASFVWAQGLTRVFGYAEEMLCFVVIAEEVSKGSRGWATGTISALYYLGAGIASLMFGMISFLPYDWRALYIIGALPLFLVAYLRRNLPETQRFAAQESVVKAKSKLREARHILRDLVRQYPARLFAILAAAGAFGFAVSSASALQSKYLQSVFHYTPLDVNLVVIPGGLVGLGLAIAAGKLSDRIGRKKLTFAMVALTGSAFAVFYSGIGGAWLPVLWIVSFFAFFSSDALIAGFALEIMPTHYRATVSGLRYLVEIGMGAVALALEGPLYDHFNAHGPAIQMLLCSIPITLIAILFLPEPAGRNLEELTGETQA